jgi:hypothetical protein
MESVTELYMRPLIILTILIPLFTYSQEQQPTESDAQLAKNIMQAFFVPIVKNLNLDLDEAIVSSNNDQNQLNVKSGHYYNTSLGIQFENLELVCTADKKQKLFLERLLDNCLYDSYLNTSTTEVKLDKSKYPLSSVFLVIDEGKLDFSFKIKKLFKWKVKGVAQVNYQLENQLIKIEVDSIKLGPISLKKMLLKSLANLDTEYITVEGNIIKIKLKDK